MRKYIFLIMLILIVMFFACGKTELRPLPEGYKLLCSSDGEKYCLMLPYGRKSVNIWDSKRKAISFAYYWEEDKNKPIVRASDRYSWSECTP